MISFSRRLVSDHGSAVFGIARVRMKLPRLYASDRPPQHDERWGTDATDDDGRSAPQMRAEQHVSARRRGELATLTTCRERDLPLLKTPEGTSMASQQPGVRGMSDQHPYGSGRLETRRDGAPARHPLGRVDRRQDIGPCRDGPRLSTAGFAVRAAKTGSQSNECLR
jgi:hypothetical protein